jgi:hypothetical protein
MMMMERQERIHGKWEDQVIGWIGGRDMSDWCVVRCHSGMEMVHRDMTRGYWER